MGRIGCNIGHDDPTPLVVYDGKVPCTRCKQRLCTGYSENSVFALTFVCGDCLEGRTALKQKIAQLSTELLLAAAAEREKIAAWLDAEAARYAADAVNPKRGNRRPLATASAKWARCCRFKAAAIRRGDHTRPPPPEPCEHCEEPACTGCPA